MRELHIRVIPQYCIVHPYCAYFSHHQRANNRHVHNEGNFPQAKLNSKMNVRFLFNKRGDLYVLLHNNSVHILLKEGKKDIGERVHKTATL